MKKYLIISSILAFVTIVVCSILLFFNHDFKKINWPHAFNFQNEEQQIIHSYQSNYTIDLNLEHATVEIAPSDDGTFSVYSYYNQDENIFTIDKTKDKLSITQKKSTEPEFAFLAISSRAYGKIILYLPEEIQSNITIHGTNSDVSIHDIHGTKIISSTTNGAYEFRNLTFTEQISLSSTNGALDVSKLKTKNLTLETSNGIVECSNILANQVEIQSTNGVLDTSDVYAKKIILETINGTISLINKEDTDFVIDLLQTSTKFGDIDIEAKYKEHIKK